jgi:hypothetical protein
MQQEGRQIYPPKKGRTHSPTSIIANPRKDPPDRFRSDDRQVLGRKVKERRRRDNRYQKTEDDADLNRSAALKQIPDSDDKYS